MQILRLLISFSIGGIFGLSNFSCHCKNQKIVHMDFLDNLGVIYNIMDSAHKNPLKDMNACFLINQNNLKCINFKTVEKFIDTNSFIQSQIHKNYSEFNITFYKESNNTDELMKFRSQKALTLCNDDIIVEYLWSDGQPSDTFYYKKGQIEGSEKIQLLDIKDSTSHN